MGVVVVADGGGVKEIMLVQMGEGVKEIWAHLIGGGGGERDRTNSFP